MKIKRIISLLILSCMLLASFALVSCSEDDGTPEGYQLVVNNGDRFRLYVPTQGWTANTEGGVTSATFGSGNTMAFVAVYVADCADGMTLSEYWEQSIKGFDIELIGKEPKDESAEESSAEGTEAEKKIATPKLGGKDAEKYFFRSEIVYGADVKIVYRFIAVLCKNGGDIYVLLFGAPEEEYYDAMTQGEDNVFDGIIENFTFAEPYSGKVNGETPKVDAPEGMKIASYDEHYFYFFVPESWKINDRATISSAYASDTDRSNVTMHMCVVSEAEINKTVDEYFRECEERYIEIFDKYTPIFVEYDDKKSTEGSESGDESADSTETDANPYAPDGELKMGGRSAKKFVYDIEHGGEKYRQMQVICVKGGVFYVLTYTSSQDETFDSHLPDVEKMIESFIIR